MKKFNYLAIFGLLLTAALGFTSCSDDDDEGGALDTPAFEASAAKYEISSNNSPYASIELTESGNYIIVNKGYNTASAPAKAANGKKSPISLLAKNMMAKTAKTKGHKVAPYSPILYGTYTKIDDNTYNLAGFGTVKVVTDGNGNAVSLDITPAGGQTVTYTATKQNKNLNSTNTNRLCRTWKIDGCRMYVKYNGRNMMDISANSMEELVVKIEAWMKANDPEYEPGDAGDIETLKETSPQQLVFTKTGTYMVYYKNSQLAVSTWRWCNAQETQIEYSWDNNFDSDNGLNGKVDVAFSGNKLLMTEKETETEDGETLETGLIFTMSEVK